MTPEEIELFRESVKDCPFDDLVGKNREMILFLCDAALRLAAIENAGDEEVDAACDGLLKAYRSLSDNLFHKSMNALDDIAKSRGLELAELRERLREAVSELKWLHENYSGATQAMVDNPHRWESADEREHHGNILKIIAESEVEGG